VAQVIVWLAYVAVTLFLFLRVSVPRRAAAAPSAA
jgi:hypothetical protein